METKTVYEIAEMTANRLRVWVYESEMMESRPWYVPGVGVFNTIYPGCLHLIKHPHIFQSRRPDIYLEKVEIDPQEYKFKCGNECRINDCKGPEDSLGTGHRALYGFTFEPSPPEDLDLEMLVQHKPYLLGKGNLSKKQSEEGDYITYEIQIRKDINEVVIPDLCRMVRISPTFFETLIEERDGTYTSCGTQSLFKIPFYKPENPFDDAVYLPYLIAQGRPTANLKVNGVPNKEEWLQENKPLYEGVRNNQMVIYISRSSEKTVVWLSDAVGKITIPGLGVYERPDKRSPWIPMEGLFNPLDPTIEPLRRTRAVSHLMVERYEIPGHVESIGYELR